MVCYDVFADVVKWLRREGSASYRALKGQFNNMNDDYLDDPIQPGVAEALLGLGARGGRRRPDQQVAGNAQLIPQGCNLPKRQWPNAAKELRHLALPPSHLAKSDRDRPFCSSIKSTTA